MVYSSLYGLLSIGGKENGGNGNQTKEIYNLSFNDIKYDNSDKIKHWNWKLMTKLDNKRCSVSATMINKDKHLFIAGGFIEDGGIWISTRRVLLYNIENDEWKELKSARYARYNTGMYYDKIENNIYLAGGNEGGYPLNKVESYDISKNKWYRLPNTNLKHGNHTRIWKQNNQTSNNILNIISFNTNSMETLDLRCNDGWNIVYQPSNKKDNNSDSDSDKNDDKLDGKSLSDLFGIHYINDTSIKNREDKCRFIRFTD